MWSWTPSASFPTRSSAPSRSAGPRSSRATRTTASSSTRRSRTASPAREAELVLDLSDEPVVTARDRFRLASRALAAGVPYVGADFRFDPVPFEPFELPSLAVIGSGKRVGKTAVAGHVARLLAESRDVIVVAMGRGGPPEPVVVEEPPDVDDLLERARAGSHAASDYLEDAALAHVTTVGCRRCGGGLAGNPFVSNVSAGARAAAERKPELVIFEGSGAALPPVAVDARVLVTGGGQDPGLVAGYLGAYRILVSDLVVLTGCEEPLVDGGAARAAARGDRGREPGDPGDRHRLPADPRRAGRRPEGRALLDGARPRSTTSFVGTWRTSTEPRSSSSRGTCRSGTTCAPTSTPRRPARPTSTSSRSRPPRSRSWPRPRRSGGSTSSSPRTRCSRSTASPTSTTRFAGSPTPPRGKGLRHERPPPARVAGGLARRAPALLQGPDGEGAHGHRPRARALVRARAAGRGRARPGPRGDVRHPGARLRRRGRGARRARGRGRRAPAAALSRAAGGGRPADRLRRRRDRAPGSRRSRPRSRTGSGSPASPRPTSSARRCARSSPRRSCRPSTSRASRRARR